MPEQAYGSKPLIDIDGKRLPTPFDEQITTVVVDQDLTSATYCQVTIADPGRDMLRGTGVELGQELKASASPVAAEKVDPIFVGTVHSIDVVYAAEGQSVVLTGFDDSYLLTQHRLSRSFNNTGLSTVIKELCQIVGVEVGRVETDSVVAPQVGLFDETPWDFITRSAARSGCVVRFDNGRLEVVKPVAASTGPDPGDHGAEQSAQLVPGHNLTYLRVHSTTARQVGEVEVRGWDVAKKQHVSSSAPTAAENVVSSADPADVGRELGMASLIDPRPEVDVQAVTDLHAESIGAGLASQYLVAEGEAIGDPELKAGGVVSIGAVDSLSGKYLVTWCRHRFDDSGYATEIRCSGHHNRALFGLLGLGSERSLGGVYPGVVTDLADPDELGRVRVTFPWLSDDYESAWARVAQVGAGADRGLHWFPEVEDEVAVAFVAGRPEAPVVLGGLYNGADKPPFPGFVDGPSGQVTHRGFKTRAGHRLELIDKSGQEGVVLVAEGDITIEAKGGTLTLKGNTINLN